MEIPYNVYNIYDFHFVENQHIIDMFDVKKVQSKAGGLYDVLNGLFIDFHSGLHHIQNCLLRFLISIEVKVYSRERMSFILLTDIMDQPKSYPTLSVLIIIISSEEKAISIRSRLRS